jgi:GntR family transcriptional regulator
MRTPQTTPKLLRKTPEKLYLQVAQVLRDRIVEHRLPGGTQLPTTDALVREFKVATVTVRQALALLEAEGLVTRQQGRGVFTTGHAIRPDIWLDMNSRLDLPAPRDGKPEVRIISAEGRVPLPPLEAQGGNAAAAYHHIRRLHSSDGVLYAFVELYLDEKVYEKAPKRFDRERVALVLPDLADVAIRSARETFRIGRANDVIADLLQIPLNDPIGIAHRTLIGMDDTIVQLTKVAYRGDVVRLDRSVDLGGNRKSD